MKKRIIIGDPHGRWNSIKKIYDKSQPDEVIILGDYFDSFTIHPVEQRENYDKLIELRKQHLKLKKGKFIMLIGNHDMHYMSPDFDRCSGWNPMTDSLVGFILSRDWDKNILTMCFVDEVNKTIYSHAGVGMNWFNSFCSGSLGNINTLAIKYFNFTSKDGGDWYGSSAWNSPLWIRPKGLKTNPYTEWKGNNGIVWNQVFGHTESEVPIHWTDGTGELWGIDCINRYYMVEELDNDDKLIKRYIDLT